MERGGNRGPVGTGRMTSGPVRRAFREKGRDAKENQGGRGLGAHSRGDAWPCEMGQSAE